MIFFTADHHFEHKNMIRYASRPFVFVEDMNDAMVSAWNREITDKDTVYHLGDFTLGGIDSFVKWSDQLRGQINIIPGNHDGRWMKKFVPSDRIRILEPLVSIKTYVHGIYQVIVLCHYSMNIWDKKHYGSWHLFGHSHGKVEGIGKSFDVGVDCNRLVPFSMDQVARRMSFISSDV